MSATDFDLLVVGASFGGAACAIAAASAGLRVCVLERKRDPGERLIEFIAWLGEGHAGLLGAGRALGRGHAALSHLGHRPAHA